MISTYIWNFKFVSLLLLELCSRQKLSVSHFRGDNSIQKQELWPLHTALPLDDIYPPINFQFCISYTFGVKLRTKIKCYHISGEITQKYESKSYGLYALHFPLMISTHLWIFKFVCLILLELCSRQKLSVITFKGR